MSQNSFNYIDCFADQLSSPKPTGSPVRSSIRPRAKRAVTGERRSPRLPAIDHVYDDDLNSSITLGRHSGQLETRTPNVPTPELGIKEEFSQERNKQDSRGARKVADSEDEDDEAEFIDRLQDLKQEPISTNFTDFAIHVSTKAQRPEAPKGDDGEDRKNPGIKAPNFDIKSTQLLPAGTGASPFQRDSPTKLPLLQHSSQASQLANSSDPSSSGTLGADKKVIQSFLNFHPRGIPAILDGLYCARRDVATAIYNCNLEGKRPVDELQWQPAAITARIKAIERLMSLREEHLTLSKFREESKARVIAAISEDLDEHLYAQDMKDKVNATRRLSKIEAEISELLVQAELIQSGSLSESTTDYNASTICNTGLGERSTTLVKSTQVTPQNDLPAMPNPPGVVSSGPLNTQYIQQTQAPNDFPRTPRKHPYEVQTYTSSPKRRDKNTYFSPPKQSSRRGESMRRHEPNPQDIPPGYVQHDAESNTDYFDDVQGDQDIFTTNMGTPFQSRHDDDEYGNADDDMEDFEAAAQEAENQNCESSSHHGLGQRRAFTETSGNVMRSGGTRAASAFTHAPPQLSQMQHPWSRDVKTALKERFHLRGFRPNQLEAINATLAGNDAFVLMPTGGGKSLCYQLPAIVNSGKTQGVTVVISPLLSLMQDQVEHLLKLQIQALLINSEVTAEHRRLVMGALKNPHPQKFCQLLYITPEMINKSQAMVSAFRDLWQRQRLARIVIDEAHCVSQWGHDFRPDYKLLGEVRQQFRGVPVIALTATATENVKVDVIHNLGIQNCEVFTQSFNRPNLSYEVRNKSKGKEVLESMAKTINTSYQGQSGIIYCLSKKNCEDVATKLREDFDITAHHYHAGMEPDEKKAVQKQWQAGNFHVIVATIAFGMGIDKPDVRFVIHHTIPKSLEGYYQETGRAGRDGKRSGCFMYYGYQDTSMIKRMIDDGEGSYDQKERQRLMLRNVIQFCENKSDCRRVQVLNYFNESFNREDCRGACDNCNSNSTFETQDFSNYAITALSMVKRIEKDNVTLLHCVDVFRGSKSKKIIDLRHESLQEYGAGSEIDRGNVERLFYRLLSEDALSEHNVVNKAGFAQQYIHIGKNSYDFSKGRRKLKIQIRMSPTGKAKAPMKAPQKSSKKAPKKSGTGVAAAHPDYPASTNVSSPIQAASRRRVGHTAKATPEPGLYRNGYAQDGFVVDDDYESDAFSEMEPILISKTLSRNPFTDTMLREMAITFPEDESQMLKIPGISQDKVSLYGKQFLKLVQQAQLSYENMMQQQYEDRPQDPNHQIYIDLISDDEAGNGNEFDDDDVEIDEESQGEISKFFQPSIEVDNFNATLQSLASAAPSSRAQSASNDFRGRGGTRGGKSTYYGRGAYSRGKGRRKASGGSSKGKTPGGVNKSKSTSSRSSGSSFGQGPSNRGGSGVGFGRGGGGIGMMPT
ncbi:bloom syndrome protein, partial [Lecanoromycetidae sp. Uapishka_2]